MDWKTIRQVRGAHGGLQLASRTSARGRSHRAGSHVGRGPELAQEAQRHLALYAPPTNPLTSVCKQFGCALTTSQIARNNRRSCWCRSTPGRSSTRRRYKCCLHTITVNSTPVFEPTPASFWFSDDRPIRRRDEDQLGRTGFAAAIAKAICGWRGQESLVIGLHGQWGSGKSSVKNMVRETVEEESGKPVRVVEGACAVYCW